MGEAEMQIPCHKKIFFLLFFFLAISDKEYITRGKKERKKMEKMFDENGNEWLVDDATGWDPIMGDEEDWVETDDEWLDDFQGEEDFA
jgi:hypothetical protein